ARRFVGAARSHLVGRGGHASRTRGVVVVVTAGDRAGRREGHGAGGCISGRRLVVCRGHVLLRYGGNRPCPRSALRLAPWSVGADRGLYDSAVRAGCLRRVRDGGNRVNSRGTT